jgi:hypothetical protein
VERRLHTLDGELANLPHGVFLRLPSFVLLRVHSWLNAA